MKKKQLKKSDKRATELKTKKIEIKVIFARLLT
jgi:hypothetical protein